MDKQGLIVDPSQHMGFQTAGSVAAIFGRPAEDAGALFQRQKRTAEQFWQYLVQTPDHLGSVLRRLTAKEKQDGKGKIVETPDGRQVVPELVAALVDAGWSYATAEKMFSQMAKERQAYETLRFIPPAGSSWDKCYELAVAAIREADKGRKAQAKREAVGAFVGAHIRDAITALPAGADKDAKLAAIERAEAAADQELKRRNYLAIARKVLKDAKATVQDIPHIVNAFEEILAEWQSQQSASQVDAAEVESTEQAQGIETPTPALQPERQRNVA